MRPRTAIIFLIITIAFCWSVAQNPVTSVEGRVADAGTSQAIRGAAITLTPLSGGGSRQQATSDQEGHFSITGLAPGKYRAFIQARGYIPKVFGSNNQPSSGSAISMEAGQHLTGLSFELKKMGVISGRVVNSEGEPMVRCAVQALQVNRRRTQPRGMSNAETDDRGEFRVFDLMPGDYYLIANCQNYGGLSMANAPGTSSSGSELAYVPMYYPGVADLKQASTISVRSGDEISADISLSKQRTYHVRGAIAGTGTDETTPIMAMLVPRDLAIFQGPHMTGVVNGKFDLAGIAPGSYSLVVTEQGPNGATKVAREEVEVASADVDGLSLTLGSLSTIKGSLHVDGGLPQGTNLSLLSVSVQSMDVGSLAGPSLTFSSTEARVTPTGTFELRDVAPGNYMVGLSAAGSDFRDWYTKSVRFNGRDASDNGLRVGSGANGTLEITVSPQGASVSGTVVDSNHQPVANVGVMAIPDESRRKRWDLYDGSRADDQGKFQLRGLASGEYSIVAAQDLDLDDRFDVDAMTKFAAEGTRVRLNDGDRKTVELNVAPGVAEENP